MFPHLTKRNQIALVELFALECFIETRLNRLVVQTESSPSATELLRELARTARQHQDAVRKRLADAGFCCEDGRPEGISGVSPGDGLVGLYPASAALRDAYVLVSQGLIGWATIFPLVIHVRDSWVMADAGTSAHIMRQHSQEYVAAAGRILSLLPDVLIDELNSTGIECDCTCPGCSIGLCLDAVSMRGLLTEALAAALPPVVEHGVKLTLPRQGSAVARSSLRVGDVIVGIDGQRIETVGQLQRAIGSHVAGDRMEFTVRRGHAEHTVTVEHRREGEDVNEDECAFPAGQPFYLNQAREARRRLREHRNGHSEGTAGLAGLSSREIQVLKLVMVGATNPIIADELEISRSTVASHVQHILNKLGAANRTEAVQVAVAGGLVASETG
jgi:DNA-binding CsgD family transcriptional regulator